MGIKPSTTSRLTTSCLTTSRLFLACALLALAGTAMAQKSTEKKLYCWNQDGRKICGDALPPGAIDLARTEIDVDSGRAIDTIGRALTATERAAAAQRAEAEEAEEAEEAARQRRDLAMARSYATEADLRHAYGERIALVDSAIKASVLGEHNLRASLVSLLKQAGSKELAGERVTPTALAEIRSQHADLQRQRRILARQRSDRASLDGDLQRAVERYRELHNPATAADASSAGN